MSAAAAYSATVVSHATEQSGRLLDDLQEEASRLSGICDELESTTGRRDQELASLSSMLTGIKRILGPGSSSEGSRNAASPTPWTSAAHDKHMTARQQLISAAIEPDSSHKGSTASNSTAADSQSPVPRHRRRRRKQHPDMQENSRSQEMLSSPDAPVPFSFKRLAGEGRAACITPLKIAHPLRASAPAAASSCGSNGSSSRRRRAGSASLSSSSSSAAGSLTDLLADVSGTAAPCAGESEEGALLKELQGAQQQRALASSMLTHSRTASRHYTHQTATRGRRGPRHSSNSPAASGGMAELLSWAEASSASSGVDEVVQLQRVETPWGSCLSTPRSGSGQGSELAPCTPDAAATAAAAAHGAMQLEPAPHDTGSSGAATASASTTTVTAAAGSDMERAVNSGGHSEEALQTSMAPTSGSGDCTKVALQQSCEGPMVAMAMLPWQLPIQSADADDIGQGAHGDQVEVVTNGRDAAEAQQQERSKATEAQMSVASAAPAEALQQHAVDSSRMAPQGTRLGLRRSHSCGQLGNKASYLTHSSLHHAVLDANCSMPAADTCKLCPVLQARLSELEQCVEMLKEAKGQVQLQLEHERSERFAREGDAALARQALRRQRTDAPSPLSMAGWEDLIEDASADLQRIEGHVCAAVQRLLDLQGECGRAASAAAEAGRAKMAVEAAVNAAKLRRQELEQQAYELGLATASSKHAHHTVELQLQAAQQQLTRSRTETEASQAASAAASAHLTELQAAVAAAEQMLLGLGHSKEQAGDELRGVQHKLQLAREEMQGAQHRLSQLQATILERRRQLATLDGIKDTARAEVEALSAQLKQARLQRSEALSEAEEAKAELQRVLRELHTLHQECQASDIKLADTEEILASLAGEEQQRRAALEALEAQRNAAATATLAAQCKLEELEQQIQEKQLEFEQQSRAAGQADLQLRRAHQHLATLQASNPALFPAAAAAGPAAAAAAAAELMTQQVALAAAESRRQLAEDRAGEAERRAGHLSSQLEGAGKQREAAEQLASQLGAKAERLKERLRHRDQQLAAAQEQATAEACKARQDVQKAAQHAAQQAQEVQKLQQGLAAEQQAVQGLHLQLEAAHDELAATQRDAQQQLGQMRRECARLHQQLEQARFDIDAGDTELQSALRQRRQWEQQAEAGQQQVSQLRQELAGTAQAPQQHEAASSAMPSFYAGQAAQLDAAENEVLRLRLELENSQAALARQRSYVQELQHVKQHAANLQQQMQEQQQLIDQQQAEQVRVSAALHAAQQAAHSNTLSALTLQSSQLHGDTSQMAHGITSAEPQHGDNSTAFRLQQALVEAQVEAELLRHQLRVQQQQQQETEQHGQAQSQMPASSQSVGAPLAAAMELLEQQLQAMCSEHARQSDDGMLRMPGSYPAQHVRMQAMLTRLQAQWHTQQQQLDTARLQLHQVTAELQQKDGQYQAAQAELARLQQAQQQQQQQGSDAVMCNDTASKLFQQQADAREMQVHASDVHDSQDNAAWLHKEVTRLLGLLGLQTDPGSPAAESQRHSTAQPSLQQQPQQRTAIPASSTAPATPQHPQSGLVPSAPPSLLDTPKQPSVHSSLSHSQSQHMQSSADSALPQQSQELLMQQLRHGLLRLSQDVTARLSNRSIVLPPGTPTAVAADSAVSHSRLLASTSASTRPGTPSSSHADAADAQSHSKSQHSGLMQHVQQQEPQQQEVEAHARLSALQDACLAEQKLCMELQRARQQEEQQGQQLRQHNQELQRQAQALQADLQQQQQAVKSLQQQARVLERQLEQQSLTGAELRRQGHAAQEAAEAALHEVRQKLRAAEEQWQQDRDSMSAQLRLLQDAKAAAMLELAPLQQSCKEALAAATSAMHAAAEATAAAKAAMAEASQAAAMPQSSTAQLHSHRHAPSNSTADVGALAALAADLCAEVRRLCAEQVRQRSAAKELGRALRSGIRNVRVRALALQSDLEQTYAVSPASGGLQAGANSSSSVLAGTQLLPGFGHVGPAVLQHWHEVEALLSRLKVDVEAVSGSTANSSTQALQGTSAERLCARLSNGLQRLQQQLNTSTGHVAVAAHAAAKPSRPSGALQRAAYAADDTAAAGKRATHGSRQQLQACPSCSSDGHHSAPVVAWQQQRRSRNVAAEQAGHDGINDVPAQQEMPTRQHAVVHEDGIGSTSSSIKPSNGKHNRRLQRSELLLQVESMRHALLANS